jgi:hypothetical protein
MCSQMRQNHVDAQIPKHEQQSFDSSYGAQTQKDPLITSLLLIWHSRTPSSTRVPDAQVHKKAMICGSPRDLMLENTVQHGVLEIREFASWTVFSQAVMLREGWVSGSSLRAQAISVQAMRCRHETCGIWFSSSAAWRSSSRCVLQMLFKCSWLMSNMVAPFGNQNINLNFIFCK